MFRKIKSSILHKLFKISETERKQIVQRIDIARMHMNTGKYTWAENNLKDLRNLIIKNATKGKQNV